VITNTARRYGIVLDDAIVVRMIKACKLNDPSAIEDEIAYMLDVKIQQLRNSKSVENMPALLAKAVPNLFPSNELQRLRTQKAREAEQSREVARSILSDPEASEREREWARATLGESAAAGS
jgi:hypothetical protein